MSGIKSSTSYHKVLPNPAADEIHVTGSLSVGNTGSIALQTVFATVMVGGEVPLYKSGELFAAISELAFYYSLTPTAQTADETATTGATRVMLWPANTPLFFHIHTPTEGLAAEALCVSLNYKATGTQRIRVGRASRMNLT